MLVDMGGVAIDPSKVVGVFNADEVLRGMKVVVKMPCNGVDVLIYVPGTVEEATAKINAALETHPPAPSPAPAPSPEDRPCPACGGRVVDQSRFPMGSDLSKCVKCGRIFSNA